ncbi:MAG: hypothetical protein QMD04_00590 [Anaerolineales bacterium]|nr:hypothetical protein [Anaerolineales bacterium]
MTETTLLDLQANVQDKTAFNALTDYFDLAYVDPRPEMLTNERLSEQIRDFQTFLVRDLWRLSGE